MKKDIINEISKKVRKKFKLECEVEGQYIKIKEYDWYIKDNDTYTEIEEKAITICKSIRESWGDHIFDVDYEIIGQTGEYDLRFLVIL